MSELARENLSRAQQQQKRWYDRIARDREFEPGDHVLVLLPTSTSKLLAQWHGPYPVKRQLSPVTYEVDMFDKHKRKRVFHVNMLRKWNTPTQLSMWTDEGDPDEHDELPLWAGVGRAKPRTLTPRSVISSTRGSRPNCCPFSKPIRMS